MVQHLFFITICLAMVSGCGGGPYDHVPVSGRIAYEDGSRIQAQRVMLRFVSQAEPIDSQTYPRPGIAEVNVQDGTFDHVTSSQYGDGLVPGEHKVVVQVESGSVPAVYQDAATTPLLIDTSDSPFDLKMQK